MSFQVLARKYRPQLFEQIVGQGHIARALQNAIKHQSPGHAYLFAGTRGIGKTSAARIFAKALICQSPRPEGNPCLECPLCTSIDAGSSMDVQEIDGAGHNGVEHMRALIENVHYLPTSGHYKVYIIDEVHMLSPQSFNALLKTLEEPPAHVVFILATTEPEKILETVLSRCQRFDFRNAGLPVLMEHLKQILQQENITITHEDALRQLCRQGKGSFRDTLSLLEQVLSYCPDKTITPEVLAQSLGLARSQSLRQLVNAIMGGESGSLEKTYRQCLEENVDLRHLSQGILDVFYYIIEHRDNAQYLYQHNIVQEGALEGVAFSELFWIFETLAKDFAWALTSMDPEKVVEVVLKKVSLRREFFPDLAGKSSTGGRATQGGEGQVLSTAGSVLAGAKTTSSASDYSDSGDCALAPSAKGGEEGDRWGQFMRDSFAKYPALVANLEQGNILQAPVIEGDSFSVSIGFDQSAEVFLDYLKDPQIASHLQGIIREYFAVSRCRVELSHISREQKQQTNFQSRSEISEHKLLAERKQTEAQLLDNQYVKQAQEVFNSRVEGVVLD